MSDIIENVEPHISREEAIIKVRRMLMLGFVSTLNEKDRPEALQAIDEVGGL